MTQRTYVTIHGGYNALLEGRYTFVRKPTGEYEKRHYVKLIGAEESCQFPVAPWHILRRLTVIKGGLK